ncbi:hypothetical protein CERZMDRAFT_91300 [Cercospora zeae-maydis SCOH1-5]|uniref:Uncharacterized protein n=1 Tax=Cercospora zeae-maydis SCOH1-5 TaxID=717836 RepID=A0A6A6F775_9PEZI|nr:hypothetical protein CERZMDRAFT_91300 [Cercospora zeae-maydis SCOH1-5]
MEPRMTRPSCSHHLVRCNQKESLSRGRWLLSGDLEAVAWCSFGCRELRGGLIRAPSAGLESLVPPRRLQHSASGRWRTAVRSTSGVADRDLLDANLEDFPFWKCGTFRDDNDSPDLHSSVPVRFPCSGLFCSALWLDFWALMV